MTFGQQLMQEGKREGLQEGLQEGARRNSEMIARELLENGLDFDIVQRCTKLPREVIMGLTQGLRH